MYISFSINTLKTNSCKIQPNLKARRKKCIRHIVTSRIFRPFLMNISYYIMITNHDYLMNSTVHIIAPTVTAYIWYLLTPTQYPLFRYTATFLTPNWYLVLVVSILVTAFL